LRTEDENPEYYFEVEVEHTMDIVRSLNRLAQLQHLYVKFFIVAPEERRSKFEAEMEKYPYRRMRDRYRFISQLSPRGTEVLPRFLSLIMI